MPGCRCRSAMKQITIDEYLQELDKIVYPVEIYGLMDDAYCPKCGYCFWETRELDCERCPVCGIRVDWTPWHRINDEEDHNGSQIPMQT